MTADRAGRRRRAGALALPVLAGGIAAGVLVTELALRPPRQADAQSTSAGTAQVVRTDIVNTIQVQGSISYAGAYTITNQAAGTAYTALPSAGAIVRRGQELYEVDGAPVTLFYGSRPEWR